MAAKDLIHNAVKNALIKDGWTITHDPFTITYGDDTVFADLAAERPFTAERDDEKIIVEVKSFVGRSAIQDFKTALGQYMLYLPALNELVPEYRLYIAISETAYDSDLQRDIIQLAVQTHHIPLIVVDITEEEIKQWIN
jgi:hypothetical protein